jgi:hypothetical protein
MECRNCRSILLVCPLFSYLINVIIQEGYEGTLQSFITCIMETFYTSTIGKPNHGSLQTYEPTILYLAA